MDRACVQQRTITYQYKNTLIMPESDNCNGNLIVNVWSVHFAHCRMEGPILKGGSCRKKLFIYISLVWHILRITFPEFFFLPFARKNVFYSARYAVVRYTSSRGLNWGCDVIKGRGKLFVQSQDLNQ